MDASHLLAVEPLADEDRTLMGDPVAREGDRLGDHVVGRDEDLREVAALEFLEDLCHRGMVRVVHGEEGEEDARIDEDHSSGSP